MTSHLLVLDSSARLTRSITRRLTQRFVDGWLAAHPDGLVTRRDLGLKPPSPVDERWIAAAFSGHADPGTPMAEALHESEALIAGIEAADAIVLGAPIYNFGMPASLKAYIDQIVRVGRTFAFEAGAVEPYRPLLDARPVVVIVSAGDGALHPGGSMAHLNFLEGHLTTALGFIGLTDVTFVRVGHEEFQDDHFRNSLATAEATVDALAARVVAPVMR